MDLPEFELAQFPIRVDDYSGDRAAYERLLRAMSDSLGLGDVVPNITSAPSHREAIARARGPCVAHVRIRKGVADKTGNPPREYVEHSFVVVDTGGVPVVWSPDLDPVRAGKVPKMLFLTPGLVAVPVVERVKAYLAANAPPKPARKTKTAAKKTARLSADGVLRNVVFSPDGATLAAIDDHATIWLWDTATGELRARTKVAGDGLRIARELAFSPDGRRIAAGHSTLVLLDTQTAGIIEKREAHPKGELRGLCWRGERIATASATGTVDGDHRVAIWNAATGALEHSLSLDSPEGMALDRAGAVAFALSSQRIDEEQYETKLVRVELASGEQRTRSVSASTVIATADALLIAEGRLVLGGGQLAVLDPVTLEPRSTARLPEGVELNGWTGREAVGHDERELVFVDPREGTVRRVKLPDVGDAQARIRRVAVTDDGARLAVAIGRWVFVLSASGEVVLPPG